MHRTGSDPNSMTPDDFVCDFSGRAWDGMFPMVEGHQGSLISGDCLTIAYRTLVLDEPGDRVDETFRCTMCLEDKDPPGWQSPVREEAIICARCVKQSAGRLHKDPDWPWSKPRADDQ